MAADLSTPWWGFQLGNNTDDERPTRRHRVPPNMEEKGFSAALDEPVRGPAEQHCLLGTRPSVRLTLVTPQSPPTTYPEEMTSTLTQSLCLNRDSRAAHDLEA